LLRLLWLATQIVLLGGLKNGRLIWHLEWVGGWAYLRALGTPAAPGQPHVLVTWRRRGAAIPAVAGEAVAEAILAGLALALLLLVAAILVD